MKVRKILAVSMAGVLMGGLLTGCGAKSGSDTTAAGTTAETTVENAASESGKKEGGVSISLLNTKGGSLVDPLEEMADLYEKETGVHIDIINAGDGQSPFEKISTMYSAGDPPTIAMLDETDVLTLADEKALDLSGEKWNEEVGDFSAFKNGKVYGFPFCVEGKGLIYNKNVIEEKLGREFDPAAVKNLDDFSKLCDELVSAGLEAPVLIMKEDWSLGSHFLQYIYETQGNGSKEDIDAYLEKLKAGEADVMNDARFISYIDTFETLMNNYNYKKIVEGDPLGGNNATDGINFAEGETAFYFNGSWAWGDMKEYVDDMKAYGMMPYPVNSEDADDFVHDSVNAWASKQLMIDREKSTPEQQQAAKDFINWIVYDEAGQDLIVNKLNLISPCRNNTLEAGDPLGASLKSYVDSGKVFDAAVVPGDHWSVLGVSMQKFLASQIDRSELAREIEEYWKTQN